jgi:hypothetical protein
MSQVQPQEEYKHLLSTATARLSSLIPYPDTARNKTYTFTEKDRESAFLLLGASKLINIIQLDIPDKYMNNLTLDLAKWLIQERPHVAYNALHPALTASSYETLELFRVV